MRVHRSEARLASCSRCHAVAVRDQPVDVGRADEDNIDHLAAADPLGDTFRPAEGRRDLVTARFLELLRSVLSGVVNRVRVSSDDASYLENSRNSHR